MVVLDSTSSDAFCAGADLSLSGAGRARVSDALYALYERVVLRPAPFIAAVVGQAVGDGAQLALAADLRTGGPGNRIRFVGPTHGLPVGAWGLRLARWPGKDNASHDAHTIDGEEAHRIGLLDLFHPDLSAAALELASSIARLDAEAVACEVPDHPRGAISSPHRGGNASRTANGVARFSRKVTTDEPFTRP